MDAIDARDWPGLAEELGDLMLQSVFYAQMASEAGHFRIEDSLDAINEKLIRRHPHIFGDCRGEHRRRRQEALGRNQGRGKEGQGRGRRNCCSKASPARCPRWWKRSRSARAPQAPASIGTTPSRCSRKLRRGTARTGAKPAESGNSGRDRRRDRRSAVRPGQSRAVHEGGSRAGSAQDATQIPPPLRARRDRPAESAAKRLHDSDIEEMEELWQEAKQELNDRSSALTEHRRLQAGRPAAEGDLGLRRHRTAARAAVCGRDESRRPGARRLRWRPHGRLPACDPGNQAGGGVYLHSHMMGVLPSTGIAASGGC